MEAKLTWVRLNAELKNWRNVGRESLAFLEERREEREWKEPLSIGKGRIETGEGEKRERAELKADGDVRVPDVVNWCLLHQSAVGMYNIHPGQNKICIPSMRRKRRKRREFGVWKEKKDEFIFQLFFSSSGNSYAPRLWATDALFTPVEHELFFLWLNFSHPHHKKGKKKGIVVRLQIIATSEKEGFGVLLVSRDADR